MTRKTMTHILRQMWGSVQTVRGMGVRMTLILYQSLVDRYFGNAERSEYGR